MWYFAWLLGLPLAATFAVMNAMFLEMQRDRELAEEDENSARVVIGE
ncbi:cyd operon protein YbgT [Roseovarius litoreus]|jgi:cyd operon protein YbgT|uniref:Cyd operon protein YbgT n=1 Tax=Roseovarius litoreus TaxID=1155722 RepID=A0A1M7LH22_9RHOB|nr:cytochrome bd-I oxidase subunit CydX [Roseovarius litoreus]SHM77459.1 cyd operon protein YbgT [Roseovarius litoreus]